MLWIRIFLKDYDSSILINNILLLLFRTTLCMTTLHMIVNVIIIHYICCRVVRSPISFCKLLFIYQYFSIITITSLEPHMAPITLSLSMHYNRRYCLLYVFTLSRTTLVLYKDKFCLVLFHFHIFSLTNFSKLSLLYILYLKYNIINYVVLLISYYVHLASLIYVCITCIHVNHVPFLYCMHK